MWHEARRQERKIRGMLVDYRKRAERRRDFYEKIKADPTQFLQVHGRQCKIHLDQSVALAADNAVMMPWQGQSDILIDRFDVRAHLDFIPPIKNEVEPEPSQDERQLNYERFRIIAQNAYLAISEEKFLKQLYTEEQFGYMEIRNRKEPKATGAAIGFNYDEGTAITAPQADSPEHNSDVDNSDSDLDVDLAINVSRIDPSQAHEMNKHGLQYGMLGNDFYSFLTNDLEEAENYKIAKEEEQEKALFSGRKSRRERRAHREKRLAYRKLSPPSYAAKESPSNSSSKDHSKSPSKSPSPDAEEVTYITSFGDDEPTSSKPTYAETLKYGKSSKKSRSPNRSPFSYKKDKVRSKSRENSFSKRNSDSKSGKSRSRSASRHSRSRNRYSRSRSGSRKRTGYVSTRIRSGHRSYSSAMDRRKMIRSRSRSEPLQPDSNGRHFLPELKRFNVSRSRSRSKRSRSRSRFRRSRSRSRSRKRSRSLRRSVSSNSRSSSLSSSSSSSSSSPLSTTSSSLSSSPTNTKSKTPITNSPRKSAPRYYGRKRSRSSSIRSSTTDNDTDERSHTVAAKSSKYASGNNSDKKVKTTTSALTVIERLKRKRQAAINRHFIKDKIAEEQKLEREKLEQLNREEELREMAIKLRRRQREKRHAYDRSSSSDSEGSSCDSQSKEYSGSPPSPRDSRSSTRDHRHSERSRSRDRNRRSRDIENEREHIKSLSKKCDRDNENEEHKDKEKDSKKLVDY